MKKRFPLLLIFVFASFCYPDATRLISFNPGIKLGYQFGKNHGFIIGIETSISYISPYFYFLPWGGVVGGSQYNFRQRTFLHYAEAEIGLTLLGFSLGYEWKDHSAVRYRVFAGYGGFISYKSTFEPNKNRELSLIAKKSLPLYQRWEGQDLFFGEEPETR